MFLPKFPGKKFLSALAITTGLLTGIQAVSLAQSNSGITLWSGIQRQNILRYHADFGGRANAWDRYRFRIPAKKNDQRSI